MQISTISFWYKISHNFWKQFISMKFTSISTYRVSRSRELLLEALLLWYFLVPMNIIVKVNEVFVVLHLLCCCYCCCHGAFFSLQLFFMMLPLVAATAAAVFAAIKFQLLLHFSHTLCSDWRQLCEMTVGSGGKWGKRKMLNGKWSKRRFG